MGVEGEWGKTGAACSQYAVSPVLFLPAIQCNGRRDAASPTPFSYVAPLPALDEDRFWRNALGRLAAEPPAERSCFPGDLI
jgi:hypothetical protein